MSSTSYDAVAQAYADGVRVLLAPSGAPAGERGGRGPVSYQELADQAEKLSSLAAELTTEAAAKIRVEDAKPDDKKDPAASAQAATQLLAKAATDLQVGIFLLEAARDEEQDIKRSRAGEKERGGAANRATDELLDIIVGRSAPSAARPERATRRVPRNPSAELMQTIGDVLAQISKKAKSSGEAALGGLLGLGLMEIGQVCGQLGLGLAQALGQAEAVTRLYNHVRGFIEHAYNSLISLIGQPLAQALGPRILEWLDEVREARFFGGLLERLYQTEQTKQALAPLVQTSPKLGAQYVAVTNRLEAMGGEYAAQIRLADRILKGLKWLGSVPSAILPYGPVVMALVYLALLGYVVLCGADYVDAPHLSLLNRVPGVGDEVKRYLG